MTNKIKIVWDPKTRRGDMNDGEAEVIFKSSQGSGAYFRIRPKTGGEADIFIKDEDFEEEILSDK